MKNDNRLFYQEIITQKSWKILQSLKKQVDFVLIGGWAVYLYTKVLKSKDIDIIVDFSQLEELKKLGNFYKNERLKKYEVKREEIDIDIYTPFYSTVGLAVEEIQKYQDTKEGFSVLKQEALLISKLAAYESRKMTVKGQKDRLDSISLLLLPDFDFNLYKKLVKKYRMEEQIKIIEGLFRSTSEVPELNLNKHFFAKKRREILEKIR